MWPCYPNQNGRGRTHDLVCFDEEKYRIKFTNILLPIENQHPHTLPHRPNVILLHPPLAGIFPSESPVGNTIAFSQSNLNSPGHLWANQISRSNSPLDSMWVGIAMQYVIVLQWLYPMVRLGDVLKAVLPFSEGNKKHFAQYSQLLC